IADCNHYSLDLSSDDRIGARRCATVMIARLERNVESGTPRFATRHLERDDLRVRLSGSRVKSFPDNLTVANDYCADHRIRLRLSPPTTRELERVSHEALVGERISRG